MPRLEVNLYRLFCKRKGYFTPDSIFSLGIQIVNVLEQIHAAGFVYNDLKLDNLMLEYGINTKMLC